MVINISSLFVGKSVSTDRVAAMLNSQSYTRFGSQVIGEAVLWYNGQDIESGHHLNAAPNGTKIQVREHYYGVAVLEKYNETWSVISISKH
jgi:hypothetical protein